MCDLVSGNFGVPYTAEELQILSEHYPSKGLAGFIRANLLPDRSYDSIKNKAFELGLRVANNPRAHKKPRPVETDSPVPAQTVSEGLDCDRLKRWRGPVNRAPMRASL